MTITNNSPSAGYIQWSGLHMQYMGVCYDIADGYTDRAFAWWTLAYPNNLVVSNDYPSSLTANDCVVFLNKSGIATCVPTATTLDGDLVVPGSILTLALASECVTTDKLAVGSVSADVIAANAIGADKIAANVIGTEHLSAGCVTSDRIVSGAVTTDKLAASSVIANKIAAGAVTADAIAAHAITASKIAAGAITTNEISPDVGENLNIRSNAAIQHLYEQEGKLSAWQRFDENGMELGKTGSPFAVKMDNEQLSFYENGVLGAYMSNLVMHIKNAVIDEGLNIGNYVWQTTSDGGVGLVWRS